MEVKKGKFSPRAQEDYKLVKKAVEENNQQAFEELMKRYRDSIYYMVLKMVHNRDDADDLTMEAFGKAFNNLHKYSPEFAFSTWLFKIAINNCIDFIRKKKLETTSLDNPYETDKGDEVHISVKDKSLDPEQTFIKEQRKDLMRLVTEKLSDKYRRLIELRYFEEYSYDEIATELDLPLGTVKAQLFRAKELLFTMMKNQNIKSRF
ncbi:MAG: sigma-70 family RNA polymerase sigma factor [Chitinophagales bacterium]|nr:sigma-70 family RNA polymerase sigma factor [Chitinophagales bacterium]